jgi:hypothetical protein
MIQNAQFEGQFLHQKTTSTRIFFSIQIYQTRTVEEGGSVFATITVMIEFYNETTTTIQLNLTNKIFLFCILMDLI